VIPEAMRIYAPRHLVHRIRLFVSLFSGNLIPWKSRLNVADSSAQTRNRCLTHDSQLSNVNVVADGVLLNGDTGLLGSVPDELDRFDHLQLLTNFNSRSIAGYAMAIAPLNNLVLYRR